MRRFIFGFSLFALSLFLIPTPSFAHHRDRVLGASTNSSDLQIPLTVEGPGFILPDSPFYLLDQIKQDIRLFFAFTPETKAKLRSDIAGERMAELRIMLAKDNKDGTRTSLLAVSDNLKKAAEEVDNARLSGRNVSTLAKTINDKIKTKQEALDILEEQSNGEMKGLVKATQDSLMESKVKVEDSLNDEDLQNEVRNDLNRLADKRVNETSNSVERLEKELTELKKDASNAKVVSLQRREIAIKLAIAQKDETAQKTEEILLEQEKKKHENLLKVQEEAAEQARKAVKEAREAAKKFQEVQQKTSEIRNAK